ncbi:MAG: flagellar motor switch protein FliG [Halieaceae bacterium]|jgi:flagellar motor switch protein FliG|nr:flagellar motor switch protein FliG [Halieaceae bacterium]
MMAEAASKLSGAQRAAILLLGVGEESAATIMRHMEPREVQRVGEAMASLSGVSDDQLAEVLSEFNEKVGAVNPLGIGASDFAQRVLVQALGEDKARSVMSKVAPGKSKSRGIEALKWMDAGAVADLIGEEHPQIIAIVLASLDEDQAAAVLRALPDEQRGDIVLRIARLEVIDPAAMEELDKVLEKQLGRASKTPPRALDGKSSAAAIMNSVDADLEASVMEAMRQNDEDLTEKIAELMFVFEDLMGLDDRGMQRLIREISVDTLVVALKGVDAELQEKFFGNMSSRAADMLREDLDAKGPMKLAEVEAAQKEILATTKQLADEGELMIGKGGDDFV